ncbi:helix-turn-helix domain-containing protein [Streptomyces anulatus]|uniref:Helix-turn-helix domain-containing protein n=2 Tax=Streptomyces TaxID=1883 RepID=A0A6G3X1V8_9ACTN|nr:helix-turn-helix domain-containing protein [Streptomyces anulatus]NEE11653.1 helix-turn-helix domain-containing protein [Streptomyces sp. SID7499]
MSAGRMERTRPELAEFLRSRRERVTPREHGLKVSGRRRTPGLRREEVAAMAGVGITWYTWLEQGRDIGVSAEFLDDLSRVLKLDAAERRHLYMLTQKRLPKEPARTACTVPDVAHDLLRRLPASPSYVLNLKWDVLAWNDPADKLFGFSAQPPEQRNMLWMTFADERLRARLSPWEEQARQILTSFKRDFAHAPQDAEIVALTENLSRMDPTFRAWWKRPDIDGACTGRRTFDVEGLGEVALSHITMTLESDRHLRFVYYTPLADGADAFTAWVQG